MKTNFKPNKAIFLDRDGVLNVERGQHTFRLEDFEIRPQVPEALRLWKTAGYHIIVVTNQSGIARKLYTRDQMEACHSRLHEATDFVIDAIYYSPYHESVTQSLGRKPGTLLFERALARFAINPQRSWMLGDKERDLIPAQALGMQTIMIGEEPTQLDLALRTDDLMVAAEYVLAMG